MAYDERPGYLDAMNATLAASHGIDIAIAGLAAIGWPHNYFARQITRWPTRYLQDAEAGCDPHLDRLIEWLPANNLFRIAAIFHGITGRVRRGMAAFGQAAARVQVLPGRASPGGAQARLTGARA